MPATKRPVKKYPRDLVNGDVFRIRTRDGWETMTVAWVEATDQHTRTIEGPTSWNEWMRLSMSPNAKVEMAR